MLLTTQRGLVVCFHESISQKRGFDLQSRKLVHMKAKLQVYEKDPNFWDFGLPSNFKRRASLYDCASTINIEREKVDYCLWGLWSLILWINSSMLCIKSLVYWRFFFFFFFFLSPKSFYDGRRIVMWFLIFLSYLKHLLIPQHTCTQVHSTWILHMGV